MFLTSFRSLMHHRSASYRRRRGAGSARTSCRFTPRLVPLEVRALLSTITVTNDNDSGAGSLRAAIADASSGETIQFAHSAYGTITLTSGPLDVATGVDIDGPGANRVAISGNNASTIFDVQAGVTATISGLTITKGLYDVPYGFGAGAIANYGTLTLSDCVVTGNAIATSTPSYGAAIFNYLGTLTINNSTLSDNTGNFGGAINNYGPLTVKDSTISGNSVSGGQGGGGIASFADVTLVNSVVSGNAGGGIAISGSSYPTPIIPTLTVTDSSIEGNTNNQSSASYGGIAVGGGIVASYADVTVTGSLIADNTAEGSLALGGGISVETGSYPSAANILTISDSTFEGNQAIGSGSGGNSFGGAIHTDPYATILVSDSAFLNNVASASYVASGGAMDLGSLDQGSINASLFSGNEAEGTGDSGSTGQGGAISTEAEYFGGKGTLTISGSTLVGNEAIGGNGSTTATGGPGIGGAIESYGVPLDLKSDAFLANEALGGSSPFGVSFAVGGAVNSNEVPPSGSSTISDSLFNANQAIGGTGGGTYSFAAGGALGISGTPFTVSDTNFLGNQVVGSQGAVGGAGTGAEGGAIWNTSADMSIQGGLISGNSAIGGRGGDAKGAPGGAGGNGVGGGIADLYSGTLSLDGVTISGNQAVGGAGGRGTTRGAGGDGLGGGINVDKTSTLTDTGGSIIGNQAIGGANGGDGEGGGVYNSGTAAFSGALIALNAAIGGSGGGQGVGGGLYIAAGTVTLSNKTKVVGNFATTSSDNIYGPYTIS
ncbi:MAG: beta strand repeat-containing protein [Isosphaeraceae bacterium]